MSRELRYFTGKPLEVREADSKRTIEGYAAVFDQVTDIGWFREKIARGAFAESIAGDVRALWSHNIDMVLGRTVSGSLRLSEDDHGLRFQLDLPDTTLGRDSFELIRRGDVSGMSFGFSVRKASWEEKPGETDLRTLEDVLLYEVSPTAFPAYPQTEVSARSLLEAERDKFLSPMKVGKSVSIARRELELVY